MNNIQASSSLLKFPQDFIWGAATAAYQIEGAANAGGRGPSVWDTFSHSPGRTYNGETGDIATDHYHLFPDDIQLMKWLGLGAYRFSVSWSRVFPSGEGAINEEGMDFYERLVDALLAAGIQPWLTCFHWDLPQALQDRYGGWQSRETALRFADYAGVLSTRLADRVKHFFTINEFWNFVEAGYQYDFKAPGLGLGADSIASIRHNALLGHGLALQAIRAAAPTNVDVGVAEAFQTPVPMIDNEANLRAAQLATRDSFYLCATIEGSYPENYIKTQRLPKGWELDMKVIGSKCDFVGVNCYAPAYVEACENEAGYRRIALDASHPRADIEWLHIEPQILYWAPRLLCETWKVEKVIIAENGCCASDKMTTSGEIHDTTRVMYLRNHLQNAARAVAENWPLKGYFAWSLMDNFEWAEGYSKRFGLFHVDFNNQCRTPKLSAEYYRQAIRANRVV
jgi:beta-glucosidase